MSKSVESTRRELFEAWFTEKYTAHKLSPKQNNCGIITNEYADPRVQMCWLAWDAASENNFKPDWVNYRQGFEDGKAETEESLNIGLKIK